jgi:hypothetical protein
LFFYLRHELLRNMGEFHEEVNLLDPYSFLNVQVADFEPVTTQCYAGFPTEVRGLGDSQFNMGVTPSQSGIGETGRFMAKHRHYTH